MPELLHLILFDEEDLQLYIKPLSIDKSPQLIFKAEPGYSMLISVVLHHGYVLTVDPSDVIKYRDRGKKKSHYCEECIILYVINMELKIVLIMYLNVTDFSIFKRQ